MSRVIMVTGASGFIGSHLTHMLAHDNRDIVAICRSNSPHHDATYKAINIGQLDGSTDWSAPLQQIDTIVHLAARAHVIKEISHDPLGAFRTTNVNGTLNLARQAAETGVRRFIFLSSIGVNGTITRESPFRPSSPPTPTELYSWTKLEAERGLLHIGQQTGLEIVIIRPPLVYGKGAIGNFARLQALVASGIPLPLASIDNKRSLIGIENLCGCIKVCLDHPNATMEPLLVSDNQDISTPDLIRLLATSSGKSPRLLPFPVQLLRMLATLTGRGPEIRRLTENLQVDCSETMRLLDWQPPVSLEEGIRRSIG